MEIFKKVAAALEGRTTVWLALWFGGGNLFHYFHRLDATYITFFTTFMGFALGHSIKEDYFGQSGQNGSNGVPPPPPPPPDPAGQPSAPPTIFHGVLPGAQQ